MSKFVKSVGVLFAIGGGVGLYAAMQNGKPADPPAPVAQAAPASHVSYCIDTKSGERVVCDTGAAAPPVDLPPKSIEDKVVDDEIAKYRIALENGTALEVCVQAGFVKAAMLQAHDSSGYSQWGQVERSEVCAGQYEKGMTLREMAKHYTIITKACRRLNGKKYDACMVEHKADQEADEQSVYEDFRNQLLPARYR